MENLQLNNTEIILQKRNAWANMGEASYLIEMKLQAMAQAAIAKVTIPKTIEDIRDAEVSLSEITKDGVQITDQRKLITKTFDEYKERVMINENLVLEKKKELYDAIVPLKKKNEENERKAKQKESELRTIRDVMLKNIVNAEAAFKTKISEQILNAYNYALGKGEIAPETLDEYLPKCLSKFTAESFKMPKQNAILMLVTREEFEAIEKELVKDNSVQWMEYYKSELIAQFSDYSVAFLNKTEALKQAAEQEAERIKAIEAQKQNAEVAAKLESAAAVNVTVSTGFKALKKSYAIDMEETVESAIAILGAFVANADKCLPKLKVNKWFSFTPGQAGIALAKVKCDDNNFAPNGLTFKEVDKL
jgi:hypothetical protein